MPKDIRVKSIWFGLGYSFYAFSNPPVSIFDVIIFVATVFLIVVTFIINRTEEKIGKDVIHRVNVTKERK